MSRWRFTVLQIIIGFVLFSHSEVFKLSIFGRKEEFQVQFLNLRLCVLGVLIACYLVYAERMDPAAAILKVRQNRSNSIQTRGQIACINEFWHFLRPLRIIFPQVRCYNIVDVIFFYWLKQNSKHYFVKYLHL